MMRLQFVRPFGVGAIVAVAVVGGLVFAQPFLAQYRQSPSLCPAIPADPTAISGSGFLMSKPTGFGINTQFVIKPNSTAFLRIDYYVPWYTSAQDIYANQSKYYITPIREWGKFGRSSPSNPFPAPLTDMEVGLTVVPVNLTLTGDNTMSLIYEVSALASAQEGAYGGRFWSTCGPQVVITIGYSYYTGSDLHGDFYL